MTGGAIAMQPVSCNDGILTTRKRGDDPRLHGLPLKPWSAIDRTTAAERRKARPQSVQSQSVRKHCANPLRTFRPRSACTPPAQKQAGTPRSPAAWAYNISGLQPHPPAAALHTRPRPVPVVYGEARQVVAHGDLTSAPDPRWEALRAATDSAQAQIDVAMIGKERFLQPFPKFHAQPPADEMAQIVAKAGVQWARHYAPLSNARMVKRWPRTRHGESFELVPGVDRKSGDHVKIPERNGSPKTVTGLAGRKAIANPSDTLELTVHLGGVDAAAAAARRLAKPAIHHGCGYSPNQAVAVVESDYGTTETDSSSITELEYNGVWKNGHRCHSSTREDIAARLIQKVTRGRRARARVHGLKIEKRLGLKGTEQEHLQIQKLQALHRGRAVRRRIKYEDDKRCAVTKIAAVQRGKYDRRKVEAMRMEKCLGLDGTEYQDAMASRIQALHRSKTARLFVKDLRKQKIEHELGLTGCTEQTEQIVKLQAVQRGRSARQELAKQTEAAIKIQAAQHGNKARKKANGRRIEAGLGLTGSAEEAERIAKIQAMQRGKQARQQTAETKSKQADAATKIAATHRGNIGRKLASRMKLERDIGHEGSNSAVTLQAVYRGNHVRRELAKQNEAATKLQAVVRRKHEKQRLQTERELELKLPTRRQMPSVLDTFTYSFMARASVDELDGPNMVAEVEAKSAANACQMQHLSHIPDVDIPEKDTDAEQHRQQQQQQQHHHHHHQSQLQSQPHEPSSGTQEEDNAVHVYSGYTQAELRELRKAGKLTDDTLVWRDTKDQSSGMHASSLIEVLEQHQKAVIYALQFRLRLRRAHGLLRRDHREPRAYLPTATGFRKTFLQATMASDITRIQDLLDSAKAELQDLRAANEIVVAEKTHKKDKKQISEADTTLVEKIAHMQELCNKKIKLTSGGTVAAKHFVLGLNAWELGLSASELSEIVAVFAFDTWAQGVASGSDEGTRTNFIDTPNEVQPLLVNTEPFLSAVCAMEGEGTVFAGAYEEIKRQPSFVYVPDEVVPPSPSPSKLLVHVGKCLGSLPKSDAVGDPDPYVRLTWLGTDLRVSTKHVDNDRTAPEWNQTVELPLPNKPGLPLRVEIVDCDAVKSDRVQHSDRDDVLAAGLVDVRSQLDTLEGWEMASWSAGLVKGEEVRQLQRGEDVGLAGPDARDWLVVPLRSCQIVVGAHISKAGTPMSLSVRLSVGF